MSNSSSCFILVYLFFMYIFNIHPFPLFSNILLWILFNDVFILFIEAPFSFHPFVFVWIRIIINVFIFLLYSFFIQYYMPFPYSQYFSITCSTNKKKEASIFRNKQNRYCRLSWSIDLGFSNACKRRKRIWHSMSFIVLFSTLIFRCFYAPL